MAPAGALLFWFDRCLDHRNPVFNAGPLMHQDLVLVYGLLGRFFAIYQSIRPNTWYRPGVRNQVLGVTAICFTLMLE
jgi:hypothetical protein